MTIKFEVELTEEDVEAIKARQLFRMQWIQAGMDEREPLDFAIQKVLNAALEVKNETID